MTRKGRRPGRKRQPNALRAPSGRIEHNTKRSNEARTGEMRDVVYSARERVFGVTEAQARAMPESSVIGRLRATGEISKRQFDALDGYRKVLRLYDRAMMVKRDTGILAKVVASEPDDVETPSGWTFIGPAMPSEGDHPEYIDWCRGVVKRYDALARALAGCGDPMARAAVQAAVGDLEAPYFIGALRIGANALAKALGLPKDDVDSGSEAADSTRVIDA